MFVALTETKKGTYRGFDRDCTLYAHAKIGILGKVDSETNSKWMSYIDMLGVGPIVYSEKSLSIMKNVINLCETNKRNMEIVAFSRDMNETPPDGAVFVGYDIAGDGYVSALSTNACCEVPTYVASSLNSYGLFDSLDQAKDFSMYANSLDATQIEPDFPYSPVEVFILK